MSETVIELQNVTKIYKLFKNDKKRFLATFNKSVKYREKTAISDVSFAVNRGEAVAVIGRNGAGKSTILKMITGVAYPTHGKVITHGRIGALLELTAGFDPQLTGRENIYLKGQLLGMKDKEIESVEADIIEFAEIGEYIDQPLRTYSSGMKARLGFAINVCIEPDILIVDEALSVGDAKFSAKCKKRVNEMIANDGVTFLFVTHSTETAKNFCKRGIVLKAGKILFDGEIKEAIRLYNDSLKRKDTDTPSKITSEYDNRIKNNTKLSVKQLVLLVIELVIFIILLAVIYGMVML